LKSQEAGIVYPKPQFILKLKTTYIINKANHIALGFFWAGLQINFVAIEIPEDDVVQVKEAKDTNWNFGLNSILNVKQ
jgi:hypothetical protein